eukprot:516784-Amphidinium_carterae.1
MLGITTMSPEPSVQTVPTPARLTCAMSRIAGTRGAGRRPCSFTQPVSRHHPPVVPLGVVPCASADTQKGCEKSPPLLQTAISRNNQTARISLPERQ